MKLKRRRIIRAIAGCLGLILASGIVLVIYTLAQLPALDAFREPARHGELVEKIHPRPEAFSLVPCSYADLPAPLINALLATSNPRYFTEPGHDVWYFTVPTRELVERFMPEGRWNRRSPWVRIRFAILLQWLTRGLSKEEILCAYLNTTRYEPGVYGINTAALRYLGKDITQCGLGECVTLTAVTIGVTTSYGGELPSGKLLARFEHNILAIMLRDGVISKEEFARAETARYLLSD